MNIDAHERENRPPPKRTRTHAKSIERGQATTQGKDGKPGKRTSAQSESKRRAKQGAQCQPYAPQHATTPQVARKATRAHKNTTANTNSLKRALKRVRE